MIRNLILTLSAATFMLLQSQPLLVAAQTPKDTVCQSVQQVDENCTEDQIFGGDGLVRKIVQTLIFITGAVSVIVIIIGGLMYVFSTGDPNNTNRAKNTILFAVIGLVVAIVAQAIVAFVVTRVR